MPALTVEQLIGRLRQFPMDTVVVTEGCDCYGSAVDLTYESGLWQGSDGYVLITRDQVPESERRLGPELPVPAEPKNKLLDGVEE